MQRRRTAAEEQVEVASMGPDERPFFSLRRSRVEGDLTGAGRWCHKVAFKVDLEDIRLEDVDQSATMF